MADRTLFKIPNLLGKDIPMVKFDFYKWLDRSNSRHVNFFDSLDLYLKQFGYSKKLHTLDGDELKTMEYIFGMYETMFTPIRRPVAFDNCLRESSDSDAYWVNGYNTDEYRHKTKNGRFKPTAMIRSYLKNFDLVYDLNPKNFYFEICNDYLFIKYQHIIGSRRICKLS